MLSTLKSSVAARRPTPWLAGALLAPLLLAACGQKGPLTLPATAATATSNAPSPSTAASAPAR